MPTLAAARSWYPANDPVHGFDHILRVYHLAGRLARSEGADLEIVQAAALLHDVESSQPSVVSNQPSPPGVAAISGQPSVDSDQEPKTSDSSSVVGHSSETLNPQSSIFNQQSAPPGLRFAPTINNQQSKIKNRLDHHHASASFAAQVLREEGWDDGRIAAVEHCIRAHRFRDRSQPPQTIEAKVLFDADKLDAIGAVGVARAIGYAVQSGMPAYATPSAQFLSTGELAPGEPHSAYHEYLFKLRHIKDRMITATGRALAEERHRWMAAFFESLAAEMGGA